MAKIVGEGQDEDEVEASGGEKVELFGDGGDEGEAGIGAKDVGGVGVEGDSDGTGVQGFRAVEDGGDDHAVAAVDAVEVANGDDGGAGEGREFGDGAGDLQALEVLRGDVEGPALRPSWARRMWGGSSALVELWSRSWEMWVKKAR